MSIERHTTDAHIDSMSTWEVISTLHHHKPSDCYPWAWKTAVELTYCLLSTQHIKMAPAPSIHGAGTGFQTYLKETLGPVIALIRPKPEVNEIALKKTKRWVRESPDKLRVILDTLFADRINLQPWLDVALSHALLEHSSRLGGLFNKEFIPYLARILDIPEPELKLVWMRSKDPELLRECRRRRPDNEEFNLMMKAFVLAAIIRGRFHEHIANSCGVQVMQHPMRAPAALRASKGSKITHIPSNTRIYLANIIVAAAFSEKSTKRRIACWAENLIAARPRTLTDDFDLHPRNDNEKAISQAVDAAKTLGVRTHRKNLEFALELSWALGVTAIIFTLHPWVGVAVGLGTTLATFKRPVGSRVAGTVSRSSTHLRDLANAGPGRIERVWK